MRDALAARREYLWRSGWWLERDDRCASLLLAETLANVRCGRARYGDDFYARCNGLAAYLRDPPLPLP